MFLESLNDFKKLCPHQPAECAIACRVYMDLILDKKYVSISKCYDETLNVFYLKAKSSNESDIIILPSLVTQDLDMNIVNKLRGNNNSLVIAICDTSSNILYYRSVEN